MAESSITVCVRIRPFSPKEQLLLAPTSSYVPFLGDGGLSGGSPAKSFADDTTSSSSPATHLRPKLLRSIVTPVDDKVLIFDPPDNNPLTRLLATPSYAPGAKRHKDVRYAFDRIFDETCGQYNVFEGTMKPLLDGVLNGYNASVFAYGATGCGKTHTISGTPSDPGVIFLTMKDLYQRIADMATECDVDIRLSYLEIYNETIRDLLSPSPTPPGQGLALREDSTNKISVVGITEHIPASPEAVLDMLEEGNRRRTMSPTEANAVSSRSHAVLQINVTQRPRTADTVSETTSASLNIIDLAGSERAAATRNNGARMKEGANINKSLLALGNCINALCVTDGRGKHVPYRNSKLTRLLKFSLGGNCRTTMIVCVSPSSAHYEETHNTLKYANQAKNIRTKISRNMLNVDRHVAQYVQAIHELKEEVAELKAKLADRGMLESVGMKRRRVEVRREVEEAKRRMTESIEGVKRLVSEKAVAEAELDGAEAQLGPARARLAEIDAALQREMDDARLTTGSEAQYVAPPDLVSERELLRAMILLPAERRLGDVSLTDAKRSLANGVHAAHGFIVAAANNSKFQPPPPPPARVVTGSATTENGAAASAPGAPLPPYDPDAGPEKPAAEEVRHVGAKLYAELERDRLMALYRASVAGREADARKMCALGSVVARTHAVLGEVVGQLERRKEGVDGDDEEGSGMVEQLKAVLGLNERSFVEVAGIRLEFNLGSSVAGGSGSGVGAGAGSALRKVVANAAAMPLVAAPVPARARVSHGRRGRASLLGAPRAAIAIPASIEEGSSSSPFSPTVPVASHFGSTFSSNRAGLSRDTTHRSTAVDQREKERDVVGGGGGGAQSASSVPAYMRATAASSAQARRHAVSRMTRSGRLSALGGSSSHLGHSQGVVAGVGGSPGSPRRGAAGVGAGAVAGAPSSSASGNRPSGAVGSLPISTRRIVSKTLGGPNGGATGGGGGGGRRVSATQQPGKRPSSPRRGGAGAASASAAAAAGQRAKKAKAFRWADEAGEGCLDDQGQGMVRFAGGAAAAAADVPLLNVLDPGSSSPLSSPTKKVAPVRRRLTGIHPPADFLGVADPDVSSSNSATSGTEWEDVTPVNPAPLSAPAASAGLVAPVSGSGAAPLRRTTRASMAAAAGSRAGLFNKAFLAGKNAVGGLDAEDSEDLLDQENLGSSGSGSTPTLLTSTAQNRRVSGGGGGGGSRDPFGEVGNSSTASLDYILDYGTTGKNSSTMGNVLPAQVPDSTLKTAPYRRESGGGRSASGSIGPVRRKRRSSAGVALTLAAASSSSPS